MLLARRDGLALQVQQSPFHTLSVLVRIATAALPNAIINTGAHVPAHVSALLWENHRPLLGTTVHNRSQGQVAVKPLELQPPKHAAHRVGSSVDHSIEVMLQEPG